MFNTTTMAEERIPIVSNTAVENCNCSSCRTGQQIDHVVNIEYVQGALQVHIIL